MPLPRDDAPWPPPELRPALDKFATWDAWWSGDPAQLRAHYESVDGARPAVRAAQMSGGILGAAARMWWGRPAPPNEPASKLHVPLAGDIAGAYANLLFGEPLKVTSEHAGSNTRLTELLDEGMQARLLEAAETVGALGGAWIRPVHDAAVSDRPWLDVIAPDAGQPEWRGGRAVAVNLWSIVATDTARERLVWRHIERHEPGRIVHALYQGTPDKIGRPVPLQDAGATAHLAEQVDADGAIDTGWPGLSCAYIPRVRPNRLWRNHAALAPMGRSLFDGAEGIFDALDETYSSLMRDVRLGKGRIIVGDDMLDDHGRGRGATYDPDREVFYRSAGMGKDVGVTHVQFAIRVDQHLAVAHDLVNISLRRCGLNGSTLGEPAAEGPAMTAREVLSKERRSMLTRETGIRYYKPELVALLGATLALDKRAFNTDVDPMAPITVAFPDTVTEDPTALAGTAEALFRGQAASTRRRVEIVNPDMSPRDLDRETESIREEFGGPVLDAPFPGDDGEEVDVDPQFDGTDVDALGDTDPAVRNGKVRAQ